MSATPLSFAKDRVSSTSATGRNFRSQEWVLPLTSDIPEDRSKAVNWDRIEGNWKEFKGKVQQKWGKLTEDDLDVIEGKRTELAGRLQQRYGVGKDEAEREIDTWLKKVS